MYKPAALSLRKRHHQTVLELVQCGLQRSTTVTRGDMKRGLVSLATIASTAPFVGLFGTVIGIMNAFAGIRGAKMAGLTSVLAGISEALVTTALGLMVAIPAAWGYNYFSNRMESFSVEMESCSSEVFNWCIVQLSCARPASAESNFDAR